jgi:hypothetical protein
MARGRSDGAWICNTRWTVATEDHDGEECHRCRDWSPCGNNCTLTRIWCRTCGSAQDRQRLIEFLRINWLVVLASVACVSSPPARSRCSCGPYPYLLGFVHDAVAAERRSPLGLMMPAPD